MHATMPSPASGDERQPSEARPTVTPELRAYLCHRALREGAWSYDLPDGRQVTSTTPTIQVSLRDLYHRGQFSLRPVQDGYLASIIWHGIYPLQKEHRHSASVTYAETVPSGFDLTEALAKEALRACSG